VNHLPVFFVHSEVLHAMRNCGNAVRNNQGGWHSNLAISHMHTMLNIVQECAQCVQNPTVVQMCSNAHLNKKIWHALKYKRQKVQFYVTTCIFLRSLYQPTHALK